MKKVPTIIFTGLITLISGILIFIGKNEVVLKKIFHVAPENLDDDMTYAFFCGILFPLVVAPISLVFTTIRKNTLEDSLSELLGSIREDFNDALITALSPPNGTDFNIRIFLPVKGIEKLRGRWFKGEIHFKIRKNPVLANDTLTGKLSFRVTPVNFPQGLVGLAYQRSSFIYDAQVSQSNKKNKYNLNAYQLEHTENAEFVATAPIFDTNTKIIAIVSIDSPAQITVNHQSETQLKKTMSFYCKQLDKFLPLIK